MKVLENTPEHLVIQDRPIILRLVFLAAILVFCGAGVIALMTGDIGTGLGLVTAGLVAGGFGFFMVLEDVLWRFDRARGHILCQRRKLHRMIEIEEDLSHLRGAVVDTIFVAGRERNQGANIKLRSRTDGEEGHRRGNELHRPELVFQIAESGGERRVPMVSGHSSGSAAEDIVCVINLWLPSK